MSRRLIFIDPSIKSPGGHHYEYAERIARAAEATGMKVLLLAHKSCKQSRSGMRDVLVPAFSRTFWENYQYYYTQPSLRRKWKSIRSFLPKWCSLTQVRERWKFSPFGLALARAREMRLSEILLRPHLLHEVSTVPSSRLTLIACWVGLHAYRKVVASASRLSAFLGRCGVWRAIRILCAIPSLLLAAVFLIPVALRRAKDPSELFASECVAALRGIKLSRDDVVFVPNATPAEIAGLGRLVSQRAPAADAEWAFLFRRPIFNGYPASYAAQNEAARMHRVHLDTLRRNAPTARVSFYTDTDQLSEQYNRLGLYRFETLPVPVDPGIFRARDRDSDVLTIGYLGDARDEKGFGMLPPLVEAFNAAEESVRPVKFLFQSNYNTPGGEPESRFAKHILQGYPSSLVELVEGPFDTREYARLLQRIDIMLIPYCAENYCSRSSGVLAEAVAAGIPAVVPSASWMAAVGEPFRRRQIEHVFSSGDPNVRCIDTVRCAYQDLHDAPIRWSNNCNYMLLRLQFKGRIDLFVRVVATLRNSFGIPIRVTRPCVRTENGEALVVFPLEGGTSLSFVANPIESESTLQPICVIVQAFHVSKPIALHGGIALYDDASDLIAVLKEVIDQYPVYKAMAEDLRCDLGGLYDPSRLVSILSGADNAGCVRSLSTNATLEMAS